MKENKKNFKEYLEALSTIPEKIDKWYLARTTTFDTIKYDIPKLSKIIKTSGGKNVHTENQYGWNNQPEVIVFNAPKSIIPKIEANIYKETMLKATVGIHIRSYYSDWDDK